MPKPFQLARGVTVSDLAGIHEGYSMAVAPKGHTVFTVNVSAERLGEVFRRLSAEVVEPGFLLLETGTHESVEKTLRKSATDPFHKDVYYLDRITHADLLGILGRHGELLVQDGGINFGFGSGTGIDEVFVGPYKVVYIYADAPEKYVRALEESGFGREPQLRTVWENFTQESPGSRHVLTDVATTIQDLIAELESEGLYLAERRED
ncbi:MAG: hypothetical protein KDC98_14195 [Planctomycetes bacterium]|nr:hypothetical protein [Planctomycetota bacterium]